MSKNYATYRRHRGTKERRGRLDYARTVEEILLPEIALTVTLDGPLVTKRTVVELRTMTASRFDCVVDGASIGQGGRMDCMKLIAQRIPSRFSFHEAD